MRLVDAVYLRKSQMDYEMEKFGEGETLAKHKKILLELAEQKELNVVEIYQEVVSGESIEDRNEVQRMLNDVQMKKYRSVIVMEVERLARGATKDQGIIAEAFKFSNTLVVTPQKTYDLNNPADEEQFEFGLYMSRREYKTIQRRMVAGKIQSVKEGNYLGSMPPFGYDIIKNGRRERTLQQNEYAKYVKMIFDWYIDDRMNIAEISRKLTDMNIPTRNGNFEWNRGTVKDIIKNVVYIGKIRWFRTKRVKEFEGGASRVTKHRRNAEDLLVVEGKHKGIISEERFALAQTLFQKTPPTESKQMINPFAGVIYCGKCGKAMKYHRYQKRPNVTHKIVHIAGVRCKAKPIAYSLFFDLVISEIKRQIDDFTVKVEGYNIDDKKREYEATKSSLEASLKKEKRKLNQIFDDYEEGFYEREEFKERKDVANVKIQGLKQEIENLVMPSIQQFDEKIDTFSNLLDTLNDDNATIIQKNTLIKAIIKRIDYDDTNGIDLNIYF